MNPPHICQANCPGKTLLAGSVPYLRHKQGGILDLVGTQSEQVVKMRGSVRHGVQSSFAVSSSLELIHKYELYGIGPSRVFQLSSDSRSKGGVPVSGVQKSVQLRGVRVSGVGQLHALSARSAFASSASESRQSPRDVLASAIQELRRAAEAKKGRRIAQRLATLAEGKSERVTWSSRKSLRGVC